MEPKIEGTSIKVDDLLVGESDAMSVSALVWAHLYKLKPKYLRSLIVRLEADKSEPTQTSLPLFKMILFFAEHLQEHMKNDPKLMKAIEQASMQNDMRRMFGGPAGP